LEELHSLHNDRFTIRAKLGAGGMGVVYRVLDAQRGDEVALKTLKQFNPAGLMLFKNEFRALVDLNHPNLIELHEFFSDEGFYYFTMELLRGGEFLSYLHNKPAERLTLMDITEVDGLSSSPSFVEGARSAPGEELVVPVYQEQALRDAFRQLATGLYALHCANKIHRDIKPSNAMVTQEGRVVLMDFGLIADTSGTRGSGAGTPHYMAPEQAYDGLIGPASDWYSVGVMLYQSLTGVLPFNGTMAQLIKQKQTPPISPRERIPEVPRDLDELCMALLHPEPTRRPTGPDVLQVFQGVSSPAMRAVSASRTMFVGRARELAALRQSLSDSAQRAVMMLIYGESGLGKSALIRHFVEGLSGQALVLSGRCYEQEQVPYKAFDGLIDALCRHFMSMPLREVAPLLPADIGLVARLFPVLRQVRAIELVLSFSTEQDPNSLRERALLALRELLSNLAQSKPLLLFIDDLQWADRDSLLLLETLLEEPAGPYCIIASVRGNQTERLGPGGALHSLTRSKGDVRHLPLVGLPPEEARELLGVFSPRVRASMDALLREANGHPLFLQELALSNEALEGGATLDALLSARIQRLDEKTRELLAFVAISGAPIEQRLLAQAAQSSPAEFAARASLLRSGFFVRTMGRLETDTIEPYHDRIRELVASRLAPTQRREIHLRLAEVLERSQGEPQTLLRHLEAAGEDRRAASYAKHAAALAHSALAFDQAAELYETALRLGRYSNEERGALRRSLADVLASAGRSTESAQEFLALAQSATGQERFELLRFASAQLLAAGHLQRGIEILNEVMRPLGEEVLSPRQALAAFVWHRVRLEVRGLTHTLIDEAAAAPKDLVRLDTYREIIQSVSMSLPVVGAAYSLKQLRLALRVGEPRRLSYALTGATAIFAMEGPGNIARCYELLSLLRKCHHHLGETPFTMGQMSYAKATVLYCAQGRIASAVEDARRAEELFLEAPNSSKMLANARSMRAALHGYHQGNYQELKTWGRQVLQDAIRRKDHYTTFSLTHHNAIAMLADEQIEALRQQLKENSWAPLEDGYQVQHTWELRSHADLALYNGEATRLLPLLRRYHKLLPYSLQIAPSMMSIFWLLGARICIAASRGSKDPLLQTANDYIKRLEATQLRFARAQAMLMRACLAARQQREADAISLLRQVIPIADEEQMFDSSAAARYRLGRLLQGEEGSSLIQNATEALRRQGAKSPEQMFEVITPGFSNS
jgi:serine/threonine protein kinase